MKVLVTKPMGNEVFNTFFSERARAEIEKIGEVIYNPYDREFTDDELKEALKDVDAVFTGWGTPKYDSNILEKADKLKIIAHTGGSAAALVSDELPKRNITLLTGNRLYAESVAEGALGYILLSQRKMLGDIKRTKEIGWPDVYIHNKGLKGKVIGLVGFGMIAENLARILNAFDVKIKIYSGHLAPEVAAKYNATICSLDEIFETCDIVSVHSALTDKNYHFIGKEQLSKMKDDALLINTARGAVINEAELIEELKTGRIRAILDVYENEPLPMDSGLRGLDNVILMPHRGGPTTDVREWVTIELAQDVKKFFEGETNLKHQISLEYASRMTDETKFKKQLGG